MEVPTDEELIKIRKERQKQKQHEWYLQNKEKVREKTALHKSQIPKDKLNERQRVYQKKYHEKKRAELIELKKQVKELSKLNIND